MDYYLSALGDETMSFQLPAPPANFPSAGLKTFAEVLKNYFDDPQDSLLLALIREERVFMQQVFTLGLQPINNHSPLREIATNPALRFLASSQEKAVAAELTLGGPQDEPWIVTSISTGPGVNQAFQAAQHVNAIESQLGGDADRYQLRVLRIPALSVEGFWLADPLHEERDKIVPYYAGRNLDVMQPYPVADFLASLRPSAEKRLAFHNATDRVQNESGG
jgi:hypothetical protein